MEILITAYFIAAFVAGMAALFAPCCITVLLPAYLGSVFKQKGKIFLMTFVFSLGLIAVFLPLGLGIGWLGEIIKTYHNGLFLIGSILLLFLGVSLLLGKHFSLPFSVHRSAAQKVPSAGSIFVLGIFSAFATLCCAPVLGGVLVLAALPGSAIWGGLYSITFALGMIAPLFFLAYFIDKSNLNQKIVIFKKQISYSLLGKKITLTISDAIAGVIFLVFGAFIFYSAITGQLIMKSSYQLTINIFLEKITVSINEIFGRVPPVVPILVIIILVTFILKMVIEKWREKVEK